MEQHLDFHHGFKLSRDDDIRSGKRRSLPILTGFQVAQRPNDKVNGRRLEEGTVTSGLDVGGSMLKSPEWAGLDDDRINTGGVIEETLLSTVVGASKKTKSGLSQNATAATAATAAAPSRLLGAQSPDSCIDKDEGKELAVEILLRGLNRPSLVAAAAGDKDGGVFFIDQISPAVTADTTYVTAMAPAAVKSKRCTLNQMARGAKINQTRAYGSVNCPRPAQTWQLRFLRWGSQQAMTLVENLCNPIGLCIRSSDLSVFVLEEVWPRRQCNIDHGQDRYPGDPRQHHRRQKRYRVCRLDGVCFSAWLANKTKRNSAGSEPHTHNGPVRRTMIHLAGQESGATSAPADHTSSPDDDQSETDWDHSSGTSEGDDFDSHVIRDAPVSSSRARSKEYSSCRPARSRRGQAVVDFVEVLELKSPSTVQQDADRHPEQPVNLCVLTDGTIVLAFTRPVPLHDGTSVTENQSVIRAFPAADSSEKTRRGNIDAASSTDTLVATPVAASGLSHKMDDPLVYNFDDSWLVAEGLPVVTGLAAGGGDAVYLSFRGARHDGVVTAIGSLSTNKRRRPLLVDTRREGFRDRVGSWKGARASPIEGASPSGRNHVNARERDGSRSARSGGSFVRIASGFASALAVDDEMNL